MGLRDRLKRRLRAAQPTPSKTAPEAPSRPTGPIRSRIDFAEELKAAPTTDLAATPSLLDDGFWDATTATPLSEDEAPAAPRYDEHPVQHPVQVTNPETGETLRFTVAPGETVLEGADRGGLELPSSCRAGGCLTCSGKRLSGEVDLDEQFVLEPEHLAAGFVLLCGTRVHGAAEFLSHQQEAID